VDSSAAWRRAAVGDRMVGLAQDDPDRALVLAHRAGDPDAFSIIFERYSPSLRAQARHLLGHDGGAEDACQETFRRALEGIGGFGRRGEWHLGAWLSTILHHVCVDQLARARRDRLVAAALAAGDDGLEVTDHLAEAVSLRAVRHALDDLRPPLRRALVMREFFGQSYAEVAAAEHITEECARTRASRARRTVQRRLAS
jgi:RNA polymerase sigma-70 factor, ECF subfamily